MVIPKKSTNLDLVGYCNADHVLDPGDRVINYGFLSVLRI